MKKIARLLVLILLFSMVLSGFWGNITVSAEDGTAPAFAEGYPKTANVTETSLDLQIKMNKKGTAYYKIVSAGAEEPTSAEVKNDGASVEVSATSAETVITGLNDPSGVAVDGEGNIYVADKGNKRVCKYDPEGTFLDTCTLTGFNDPWGVAVDNEGNIYVSDDGTANPFPLIKKYGSDEGDDCQWGGYGTDNGKFEGIRGIAVDNNGYVYATQWNNSRIQKFTTDGDFVDKWGRYGTGNGEFCNPTGVTADGNGNVYVADYWNHRIQKFTSGGVFTIKWGSNGTGNGQFFKPSGIAIDPDGNVYVTDFGQHRVQKFEPDGDFIAKWGKDNCTSGSGEEEFNSPFAAAADESGNVYVADRGNNRIQRLCCKATANVSGLAEGMAYDIYVTAEGEDGSLQQTPEKIEVTMAGTPSAPAAPIADPSAGAVVAGTVVTLTCATDGATIYYTTDGSEPTTASTEYSGPIVINTDITIKAVAVKEGVENSDVLTAEYTVVAGDEVYVSTSGNDDNDGYSWAAAKQTIKSGIDAVTAGGTVTVADGIYKGGNNRNITISKNVTIKGQSRNGAVIDGENSSRIFTIENGNVTIRDLTLSNAAWSGNGGAVSNSGTLTVAGCAFTNNAAAGFFGGGAIYNSGNITVIDSIFTDNFAYYGGSIYNANISSTVTGCTFSGNTAQYGGAVYNQSGLTVTGSTFTGNSAAASSGGAYGGAFYNDYSGNLTVTGCTLNENIVKSAGGAVYNNGTASVHFCRIVGNTVESTPQDIYNGDGCSVDANKNFWGSNGNPSGKVPGTTISTWLVLTLTAEPAAIHTGETSIVTADLLHDQTGAYHDPAEDHVPDGISVTFDTTDPSPPRSLDPSSGALADGRASSNFTADALGTANITATVDTETISLTIVIESAPLGTESNPYPITTVTELEQVRTDAAVGTAYWYKLMNDLDLSGIAGWTLIGDDSRPFKGHFDGNSHVIRNLSIGGTGGVNIGLFGCTSPTAGIKDLGLENVDIDLDRGQYVGGLVGQNKGTIDSCSVTGVVHIGNTDGCGIVIGGLVGLNYGGSIGHSHSAADVTGTAIVGGLAGGNTEGSIMNCGATGNVSAASYPTGETAAGGLVGANSGGSISRCYAAGNVSGRGDGVGGLVGANGNDDSTGSQGNINNCYATGDVSNSGDGTGGLAGGNDTGSTIDDCYAAGAVSSTGQGTGALVGGNSGSISRSYALTGGSPLVGYSDGGTVTDSSLQSSANLRKQAAFSGWDFSTVWSVTEDRGYPSLAGVSAAPAVISTIPADGAAGVSPDQTVSITFSEKIQAGAGIQDITFNGAVIGYDYSISGNTLTIDPDSGLAGGYTVTVPAVAVESLQAIPPAADCSFSFTTSPPDQYTLTVIREGNGTVTPEVGEHRYDEGILVDLTADPDVGWTFSGWSGDVDIPGGSTVTMNRDKSVTATFEENAVTHTITASALTGGSISPAGAVPVNEGSGRTFNITPDSGYIIEDVLVDEVSQGRINSYTFNDVTTGHAIEATFTRGFEVTTAANWSAVTAGSGAGGQPGPADTIIIKNGATLTVDVADGLAGTIQLGEAGASGGEGTLRFLAGKSITVNSLLLGNGNIGGNVNMSAGGTLRISGSITNVNNYGTWTHGTGTVEYCGGDQTVQGRNYYNLVTSGSGAKTLTNGAAAIYGNLTVGSGTTLYLDNSSANHITPASTGTLTLQDNGTLLINSGNLFPANYITYSLAADSTVNYNRSGIQNIAARTYGNLALSGSGTKTLQSNTVVNGNLTIGAGTTLDTKQNSNYSLTVGGDWTNNGSFNAWAGTVTLGGAATHSLGGSEVTSFNNLTLSDTVNASKSFNAGGSGTGTLTVNSGAVLNPAADVVINESGPRGALTGSGTIKVTRTDGQQQMRNQYNLSTYSLADMTVEYTGAGNQDVWYPGNSYRNLVLSGGGTKKPLAPLTVSGNLTIGGGVTLNQNSMDITVGGNWTNNGSFTASNYAVTLNGAGAQEMTGSTTFRRLTLNNAAGLTIHSDVTITDALALTSGRITTGTNKVILLYASGSISGADSSNYIVGGLQKIIAAGAATRTFEVGTAVSYNPVTVAFGNVAAAGNLTVKAAAGDHPNIGTSTIDPARSVNVYWTMANSGTVFDSCNATFNFTAGNIDAGANADNFRIGKYDGSAWTYPDIGARNAVSTQATGMTSLSDFVLGESRAGDIAAPTDPIVDDDNDTFGWTNVSGFDNVSDYEYTKDGGTTWNTCDTNPETGFDGDIAVDQVRVRVKADPLSGRPSGAELQATIPFTANPAASISSTVPTSLTESADNDGSLSSGTIVVTIANGTLAVDIAKEDVTAANLPAGLDYTVTRTADTHLTISITGNAANHADTDDVTNLTFTIAQTKVNGAACDLITENISIDFNNPEAPAAPTNPATDDANNTFGWTNVSGFDNVSDYEYTKDGGTTWNTCDANPETGFDGDIAVDQVRVRVKADPLSGRPAGAELQATIPFTANPAASISSTVPTSLTESAANDGSLSSGTIVVTIANGTLAADIAKTDVTAANLPAGLDYTVTRTDTHLTISITGNAASHANTNDVSNLTFSIAQAKVAGATGDLITANISIDFNDPASLPVMGGTVAIDGTAKYGKTLTANISDIDYTPDTSDDVPTYQWKRGEADIAGATASIYTLVQADIGQTITVTVTADGVHATGSVTSAATVEVDKADGAVAPAAAPELVSKTHNNVTLKADAAHEFRVDGGAWQDSNVFTGLLPETPYTFTARVKETATQKASAASPGLSVTTDSEPAEPDTNPPTVTDGTISTSNLTDTDVTLSWIKATDDVSIQEALQYLVYRSDFDNIDTVENIEANGTAIGIYTTDIDTKDIIGLIGSTTYYFNIIVRDEAGNKSAYKMREVTTATAPVVTYTVTYDANGGTGTAPAEGDKAEGATFAAAVNTFTAPSGKQFKEWNTDGGGMGTSYAEGATVTMPASNLILYAIWKDVSAPSDDSGGDGGPPTSTRTSNVSISVNGSTVGSATASFDSGTGTVTASLNANELNNAISQAQTDSQGNVTLTVSIPETEGANSYVTELPAAALTVSDKARIEIKTEIGTITIPGNMLDNGDYGAGSVGISIGTADTSGFDEELKAQIGDKPVIELKLMSEGSAVPWNNPDAPATVSIPYTPTAAELADPEHITVWYIDGSGNIVPVSSGRYDPATGMVTFETTHFSKYAVACVNKTFNDLGNVAWAKKQIEVMASKGIINGTGKDTFSPAANITRADFLMLLVKALGLTAEFDGNFDDVQPAAYYYEALGIAKKLGIATGSGSNRFNPRENISRQDMMVLTVRALEKLKGLNGEENAAVLNQFGDKGEVAEYAALSLATLVKEALIAGNGGRLNPRGKTTRAEAAVFLYRIYNKY